MPNDRLAVGGNASIKLKSNVKENQWWVDEFRKGTFQREYMNRVAGLLLRFVIMRFLVPVSSETTKKRCENWGKDRKHEHIWEAIMTLE